MPRRTHRKPHAARASAHKNPSAPARNFYVMKRFVTLCCVLATLAAGVCAQGDGARRPAQASTTSVEPLPLDHGGKIETAYDGFARETVITLKRMSVTCGTAKGS